MATRRHRWLLLAITMAATTGVRTHAAPDVRIHVIGISRTAVQLAIEGAMRRLEGAKCQAVFSDFSVAPFDAADPVPIWFIDGEDSVSCRASLRLAVTSPRSRVVRICTDQFRSEFMVNRTITEVVIIHELLHVYGLTEGPPSSEAITHRVVERCAR